MTEFLHPSEDGRSIHIQTSFCKQIRDVLVGQRISQIHPHGTQDNCCWKPLAFERLSTWHNRAFSQHSSQKTPQLMQQCPPDYVVIKAADEFTDKSTAINEMW
jgi:hypothetical protein